MAKAKHKSPVGRASRSVAIKVSSDSALTIPMKVYSSFVAAPKFSTLHAECGSKLKQPLRCPKCDRDVTADECSKGHEIVKDRYAVFSPEEWAETESVKDDVLSVACYVPSTYMPTGWVSERTKAYYLLPDGPGAQEAYQVWMTAMSAHGRVAVGEFSLFSPLPGAIYPENGILKMVLFEYRENVKDDSVFKEQLVPCELNGRTLRDAVGLVKRNTRMKFHWDRFKDSRRRKKVEMIESRQGPDTVLQAPGVGVVDLTSAFKRKAKKA